MEEETGKEGVEDRDMAGSGVGLGDRLLFRGAAGLAKLSI